NIIPTFFILCLSSDKTMCEPEIAFGLRFSQICPRKCLLKTCGWNIRQIAIQFHIARTNHRSTNIIMKSGEKSITQSPINAIKEGVVLLVCKQRECSSDCLANSIWIWLGINIAVQHLRIYISCYLKRLSVPYKGIYPLQAFLATKVGVSQLVGRTSMMYAIAI